MYDPVPRYSHCQSAKGHITTKARPIRLLYAI